MRGVMEAWLGMRPPRQEIDVVEHMSCSKQQKLAAVTGNAIPMKSHRFIKDESCSS
jgi:hypothetical protein